MQYVAGLLFLMGGESLSLLLLMSPQSVLLDGEVLLEVKSAHSKHMKQFFAQQTISTVQRYHFLHWAGPGFAWVFACS